MRLSPRSQVALLRFLQDREYKPVGGSVVRNAEVRILTSSNADLEALVAKGVYRQDLLYRLERLVDTTASAAAASSGDAKLLAETFLRRLSRQYGVA